ncbi:uncharacterized protein [Rutidosis leptorrhynchoides]|uniref:uncharacterized protein n=1 Tax=Rutidosis leptorrhynchoides TaxID=125765 RepID=UPI003A9A2E6C
MYKIGDGSKVSACAWQWPTEWLQQYQIIQNALHIEPSDACDEIFWKDNSGGWSLFTVSKAWESICLRTNNVSWYDIVWHAQCIPRHSFLLWLLMGGKLKTQDKLAPWEMNANVNLLWPLCSGQQDSHDHLFFACSFSAQVWTHARSRIQLLSENWKNVTSILGQFPHKKSAKCIVAKLLFGASVYFIWQERNCRLFKKKARSCDQLMEIIFSTVRLKLMSIRWKDSIQSQNMKASWKIS